ncbi:MAG: bifunctional folylpolyglutamate synthase/dihydrofolate synthase [Firmicutes bacterium]|nr:bifunctional folylpolyglutamate synthase/dihydrofolate synthase [Bacillota bacterium]
MNSVSTNSAIEKIHEFQKFGSILGLERMNSLLELLGNPQDELKIIHVAGTNGKGSVCRYIYSVLQAAGYRTGLYTSPFLQVFNERIELNGKYISDQDLSLYTDRVLHGVDIMTARGEQSPTEFEVITAIAFLYFREKGCDYAVMEVGLGGRGDSTNVCKSPLISVITSISFDHTDRLGNTLSEIAAEKAGIIKEGCPVVTSAESEEALKVIEDKASELGCMYFETRQVPYNIKTQGLTGSTFDINIQGVSFDNLEISMPGEHQIKNAICALAALSIMEERGDVSLHRDVIYRGFKAARQIGRFEVISEKGEKPLVIIDGAHNPEGAAALRKAIKEYLSGKKILMVTGVLADKDTESILKEFTAITDFFIATEPENPRKLDSDILKHQIETLGAKCEGVSDCRKAVKAAAEKSRRESFDVILYAGSLYMIGAVRGLLKHEKQG